MTEIAGQPPLPESIEGYLRAFVVRRRRVVLARAAGWVIFIAIVWLMLWSAVDRVMPLPVWVRTILLAGLLAGIGFFLSRPIARLRSGSIDWSAAAEEAERLDGRFDQRLVTVVSQRLERQEYRGSTLIVERLTEEMTQATADARGDAIVSARPAWRAWGGALAALLSSHSCAFGLH